MYNDYPVPTPDCRIEVPRRTLTEKLMDERESLSARVSEIDSVLKALQENPAVQSVLDLLQKTHCLMVLVVALALFGCSSVKEVAKTIEGDQPITFERTSTGKVKKAIIPEEHHIVLTRLLIDGYTVDQDHAQSLQHCTGRYTSEEMAAIREASPSTEHSWYKGCTHLTPMVLTKDSSKAEKLTGLAASAATAYGLHQVGRGLGKSGPTVNQQGGGANAENTNDSGNTSHSTKGDTNINSGNKNIMK